MMIEVKVLEFLLDSCLLHLHFLLLLFSFANMGCEIGGFFLKTIWHDSAALIDHFSVSEGLSEVQPG